MSKYAPIKTYDVRKATDAIKEILDSVGIEWKPTAKHLEKDDSVEFKMNDECTVDLYKQRYTDGYGIDVKCLLNGRKVESNTGFIDSIAAEVKNGKFRMYGIASNLAKNAGIITVVTPVDYDGKNIDIAIKCDPDKYGVCNVGVYDR